MAKHHSYIEVECPSCKAKRVTRKDCVVAAQKKGKPLECKSCVSRSREYPKKKPEDLRRNSRTYNSYSKAKQRCKMGARHHRSYEGVEFRFSSFEEFLGEVGERPEGMSIDRINPLGHYEPGNVRWATPLEQYENRTPLVCPHCGKKGFAYMYKRHFDNCKLKG